ncbi:MAG TPA: TolC family protein [Methylomirabilota bacterium]|nr:TolC family protein [Methylomirabilota bacterium]
MNIHCDKLRIRFLTLNVTQRTLCVAAGALAALLVLGGCAAGNYREQADETAAAVIHEKQMEALGRAEPIEIEPPADTLRRRLLMGQDLQYSAPASLGAKNLEPIEHWPKDDYLEEDIFENVPMVPWEAGESLKLSLTNALKVAARNNRDYQSSKEEVFRSALQLDLARDAFRNTFVGRVEGVISTDGGGADRVTGIEGGGIAGVSRRLKSGAELTTRIGLDLVKMLNPNQASSRALFADASIFVPLLRGAGRHIVAEPLTQAERNVVYEIYDFERFKRAFAVQVASEYLSTLQAVDRVENAEENYKGLVASARRARRLADAGQLSPVQVDQAIQDEYRSRDGWISARQSLERSLDSFKTLLGLPTDAMIELDRGELERLAESARQVAEAEAELERGLPDGAVPPADAPVVLVEPDPGEAGPMELEESLAIKLAFENRLDLRIAQGTVYDAQRRVVVAADGLRAEISLLGSAAVGEGRSLGSAGLANSDRLDFEKGRYSALLTLDLPFERTSEMVSYRDSLIQMERAIRSLQALEDNIKLQVRNQLRDMIESREGLRIQARAVELARRRVRSTNLYLQAGRVEIRDALEAQEALLSAQNALTTALVNYRIAELEFQRDLDLLQITPEGLWEEFDPGTLNNSAGS